MQSLGNHALYWNFPWNAIENGSKQNVWYTWLYMVYIVLYVYGIYSILLLQTMSLKSGRVAREACLPGSLLKHNTTRQNPLIELLLFFFALFQKVFCGLLQLSQPGQLARLWLKPFTFLSLFYSHSLFLHISCLASFGLLCRGMQKNVSKRKS